MQEHTSAPPAVRALAGRMWRTYRRRRARWDQRIADFGGMPDGLRRVRIGSSTVEARVVDRFDSVSAGREATNRLRHALTSAGARHVVLPRPALGASAIAVSLDDPDALGRAFDELADQPEWVVHTQSGWRRRYRPLAHWVKDRPRAASSSARIVAFQALATETGLVLSGKHEGVVLEFWQTIKDTSTPRTDGALHVQGTRLAPQPVNSIPYLTPTAWEAAEENESWPAHLFEVTGPVDLVYTWVDGQDPAWVARRNAALATRATDARHVSATVSSRYANHDELRYSLRSVEMYANWVRKIHIVTDGQRPDWLDVDHPKINLVDHRDIFTDPSVLPVFNSHAIESQLHHIPDLAEQYLYLNDDVFFGRPVRPELFFEGNGLTRFFTSALTLDIDPPNVRDMPVLSAAKNNREFLRTQFGRNVTRKFRHTPTRRTASYSLNSRRGSRSCLLQSRVLSFATQTMCRSRPPWRTTMPMRQVVQCLATFGRCTASSMI